MPLNKETAYEFHFRVLLPPKETDPPTVAVWYPEFEHHTSGRSVTEWATSSLQDLDFRSEIEGLEDDKCYEIIGEATIRGMYDIWNEYDEELIIDNSKHQEIDMGYEELRKEDT